MTINREYFRNDVNWVREADYEPGFVNMPGLKSLEEGGVCIDAFAPPREAFKELMARREATQ